MKDYPVQTVVCMLLIMAFVKNGGSETIEDYICSHPFKGCLVDYSIRSCREKEASGCTNPFPYENMNECMQDFYGHSNVCERYKPCENGGICSHITTEEYKRTFKCECSNTGFYGHRCEIKCPLSLRAKDPRTYPCIKI